MNPEEYQPPRIEDHGTLEELTADTSLLSPLGLGSSIAVVTGPIHPPGGGPGSATVTPSGASPGVTQGGVDFQGADNSGFGDDTGDTAGDEAGSPGGAGDTGDGGGGGGTTGGGGNGGELPFTGFPAVLAAAVGGALATAGASLRRALRPRR